MLIIYISLVINIVVAGFWGIVLFRNIFPKLSHVFGKDCPGLRVLSSLYLSIAIVSLFALIKQEYIVAIAPVLFSLQVIYKTLSVFSVRDTKNPVVISNIVIVCIHSISLYVLYTL